MEKGNMARGDASNVYINQLQAALEGFTRMADDENVNRAKHNKGNKNRMSVMNSIMSGTGAAASKKRADEINSKAKVETISMMLTGEDVQVETAAVQESMKDLRQQAREMDVDEAVDGTPGGEDGPTPGEGPTKKITNDVMKEDYWHMKKDVYSIRINNSLFYQKMGRFPQIMDLFKLIGFRKVSSQLCTAFNFLRDPHSLQDLERSWRAAPENDAEKAVHEIAKQRMR